MKVIFEIIAYLQNSHWKQINTPPVIEPTICSQVPVLFAVNPVENSRFVIDTAGALVVGYPSIHPSPHFLLRSASAHSNTGLNIK